MTKRLFILGAGSSVEYGYPLGQQLINIIVKDFDQFLIKMREDDFFESNLLPQKSLPEVVAHAAEFINALKRARPPSIDIFLTRNKQYEGIGKVAVSYVILRCENSCGQNGFAPYHDNSDNWQQYLFRTLTRNHVSPHLSEFKLDASFMTFNYDRSFEHAFFDFFSTNFTDAKIGDIERILKITHVHGSVKNATASCPYGEEVRFKDVVDGAKGIKVLYDDRGGAPEEDSNFDMAKFDQIFFLGFAYDKANLDHLQRFNLAAVMHKVRPGLNPREVMFGTGHSLPVREIDAACQYLDGLNLQVFPLKCLELLEKKL